MKININVTVEVNCIGELESALGRIPKGYTYTVSGENGQDIDEIKAILGNGDHAALNAWINYGGVIWTESSALHPHMVHVYHTDDDGEMRDMYAMRDPEYTDMDIDSYLQMLSEKALEHMGIDPDRYITWR